MFEQGNIVKTVPDNGLQVHEERRGMVFQEYLPHNPIYGHLEFVRVLREGKEEIYSEDALMLDK